MGKYVAIGILFGTMMVAAAAPARAQAGRGTIRGVVKDGTGAVVPRVEVTAVEDETRVTTVARSDAMGLYALVNLPAGRYAITFERTGFEPVVRRVEVGLLSALSVDATFQIGALSEEVEVHAPVVRDPRSPAVGAALDNDTVTGLPLNITGGRSIENFAYAIVPGVEGNNWASNIVGGAPFSKEVILDGSSATMQIQGHITESSPPMEAVDQFKVETSGMAAEYGRTGGGIFNFSLRSGTNALHGSGYGQFRNEAFDANTWANRLLARANPERADLYHKPRDRQTLGGASAGGPIQTDRTFYFVSFEEYAQTRRQLGAFDRTVPTPAFLNGDFSALLDTGTRLGTDAAGSPIYRGAIFDPRSGLVFPGNVIPAARISPVSQRIVNLYRQSYLPMVPGRLTGNSAAPAYVDPEFRQHQFSGKADHALSSTSRLSGSLIWTDRPRTLVDQGGIWDPNEGMGGPLSRARKHEVTSYQARLSHTQIFGGSLQNAATATYNRFRNPSTTGSFDGNWPRQLGLDVAGAYGSFPQIGFGDATNGIAETPIGYGASNYYVANTFELNDAVTWSKGRHLVKFGGEARFIQMNSHGDRAYLQYDFSPAQTGVQGGPFANQVGFGFASFLLGEVASASRHVPTDLYGRRNYTALFVQDDYRVGARLSLNLGLRWETTGGWREKYGHWANFNTAVVNPVTGVPGVVQYADEVDGSFEGPRHFDQFGPRIGAAYHATDRTVIRGAYGIFYTPIGTNFWSGVPYGFAPGFSGTDTVGPRGDGTAAFNWDQSAYPGIATPAVKDPAFTQWGLVSISPESLQAGRIQQWNLGVERQLARDVSVTVNYVGNRGDRLQSGDFERNQPDPSALRQLLLSGTEWSWVSDPASAAAAGVRYPYPGFAGAAWMAITPYPQAAAGFGPLFFVGSPLGKSDYHALQVTGTSRYRNGLSGSASYTLARQRGNMDSSFQERWWSGPIQDVTRLDQESRVIAAGDRRHVFKGFLDWSLPFGAGRRFLHDASGLTDAIVGGWQVTGIFRYESGLPLTVSSSNAYGGWFYPIYANRNPGVSLARQFDSGSFNPVNPADPANRYFDPAAFSNPAYGDLGTGPGRFAELRGFGGAYEDLGILKNLRFGRYTAQVRFELINVFNRRYFADPNTNLGSPYFGQVTALGPQPPRQGQLGVRFQW